VPVAPVGRGDDIAIPERPAGPYRRGLLAQAGVDEARYVPVRVHLHHALLKPTHPNNAPVELREILDGKWWPGVIGQAVRGESLHVRCYYELFTGTGPMAVRAASVAPRVPSTRVGSRTHSPAGNGSDQMLTVVGEGTKTRPR